MKKPAYLWRKMTPTERVEVLKNRKLQAKPWHAPQHRSSPGILRYHVTAACYEHRPHIGYNPARMDAFAEALCGQVIESRAQLFAWCVLPNHYHLLLETGDILSLLKQLGQVHGRHAYLWNGEENARGRKVFFRAVEREMRSDRHFWSTLNYVHHNPVHHGYVNKWNEWPWSSARDYLNSKPRKEIEQIWKNFPLLNYGQGWDDPEL